MKGSIIEFSGKTCRSRRAEQASQEWNVRRIMRTILIRYGLCMRLSELAQGSDAVVKEVENVSELDPIARRLRDYGFVRGEPVRVVGRGPIGADPLLVQIGYTRFALRRAEAARVIIETVA